MVFIFLYKFLHRIKFNKVLEQIILRSDKYCKDCTIIHNRTFVSPSTQVYWKHYSKNEHFSKNVTVCRCLCKQHMMIGMNPIQGGMGMGQSDMIDRVMGQLFDVRNVYFDFIVAKDIKDKTVFVQEKHILRSPW